MCLNFICELQKKLQFFKSQIDKETNFQTISRQCQCDFKSLKKTTKTQHKRQFDHQFYRRTIKTTFPAKIGLDPARPSRRFVEQKVWMDPEEEKKEIEKIKATARLERVKEVDEDLEKIKQKRIEERRKREEQ